MGIENGSNDLRDQRLRAIELVVIDPHLDALRTEILRDSRGDGAILR
jgi:hypothetical protein